MKRGLVNIITLVLVAVLVLGYFGVDVRGFADTFGIDTLAIHVFGFMKQVWARIVVPSALWIIEILPFENEDEGN